MKENTAINEIEVFKTNEGYLHKNISEGWWLDDDERNYSFTKNIQEAYIFPDYSPNHIPRYIGVTHDEEEIKTREQMCNVLKGNFIKLRITTTTNIEEL